MAWNWCSAITRFLGPIGRGDTPDDAVNDAFALATDPMGF
jgi:hypothetical protein